MKAKQTAPQVKHIPRRTCIACRKVDCKRGLVRLVSAPEGGVEVDLTGKKSGRGAYLCPTGVCWEKAFQDIGRLEHALRTRIRPENKEALVNYAKGFDNTDS
jgi:predicted RNA-binding protein YlxR (DUF448 family)